MAISTGAAILGGSLVSGGLGFAGSSQAGKASEKMSREALAEQTRQFNVARGDLAPWRETGQAALEQLSRALGLEGYRTDEEIAARKHLATKPTLGTGTAKKSEKEKFLEMNWDIRNAENITGVGGYAHLKKKRAKKQAGIDAANQAAYERSLTDWQTEGDRLKAASDASLVNYDPAAYSRSMLEADPSYKIRLSEGERGMNRSIAATTGVLQPGASKELMKYGSDYASNEWTNYINRLSNAAGLGQTAAQGQANISANAGTANANLLSQIGSSRAGAINNAYGSANNAVQGGIGNYLTMSMYDKLLASQAN